MSTFHRSRALVCLLFVALVAACSSGVDHPERIGPDGFIIDDNVGAEANAADPACRDSNNVPLPPGACTYIGQPPVNATNWQFQCNPAAPEPLPWFCIGQNHHFIDFNLFAQRRVTRGQELRDETGVICVQLDTDSLSNCYANRDFRAASNTLVPNPPCDPSYWQCSSRLIEDCGIPANGFTPWIHYNTGSAPGFVGHSVGSYGSVAFRPVGFMLQPLEPLREQLDSDVGRFVFPAFVGQVGGRFESSSDCRFSSVEARSAIFDARASSRSSSRSRVSASDALASAASARFVAELCRSLNRNATTAASVAIAVFAPSSSVIAHGSLSPVYPPAP